ncbi:hypothetical protein N7G274_008918 [Stereocaulon virgatum]|uniref:Terpene cyclase/mutase family member n=1 Tax=Stereocaulon virgatum TaxID=373712 RepID=A0ABR4A0F4_9LECA
MQRAIGQFMDALDPLPAKSLESLRSAAVYAFDNIKEDNHWNGKVLSNATFTAEYVFMRQALGLDLSKDEEALRRYLLADQNIDGSWGIAPECPGDVSTTTEAYLALKILKLPAINPSMCKARAFVIRSGGATKTRSFTRIWLASFGLLTWDEVPQLPMEFMLLPSWSPINIYTLSSWARLSLIPLLLVRYHQPTYPLPNGTCTNNDFLDELWCRPTDKSTYAPSLLEALRKKEMMTFAFTVLDTVLYYVGGLRKLPFRGYVRQQIVQWILHHQETSGDWAGYSPPMCHSVMALRLEGFSLDDPAVNRAVEAMERYTIEDKHGKWCQSCVSHLWDTALMTIAVCDSGLFLGDERLQQVVQWMKARQHTEARGDWRIYQPTLAAGGWSFQGFVAQYPDVDDTAAVIIALLKEDPDSIDAPCISRAVNWVLGMQNRDGGWGAFDYNNNQTYLEKLSFRDMGTICDPSTADVTGRILECFGKLLTSPHRQLLGAELLKRMRTSSERALAFVLAQQEKIGPWYGRWGVNYIYGTSHVLCGLFHFFVDDDRVRISIRQATQWLKSVQNSDGGWGEGLVTYHDPKRAGIGASTPSQTAWALMALLAYLPPSDEAIRKGITYLVVTQSVHGKKGGTWTDRIYTATGFPRCMYLQYEYYPHYFPMMALGRYVQAVRCSVSQSSNRQL